MNAARPGLFAVQDYRWSLLLNQLSLRPRWNRTFGLISRLGDGPVWYPLVFAMPVIFPTNGWRYSAMLACSMISGIAIYIVIKKHVKRPRPFRRYPDIHARAAVLDEFSFPSGHTLHAISFLSLFFAFSPVLGLVFLPFALMTAASRVILGLHFVSDVIAGAVLGFGIAQLIDYIFGISA